MKYALLDPTGLPLALGEAEIAPGGATILPASANLVVLMRQHLVDGVWQDRPAAVLTQTAGAPETVTLTDAPAGASVRIFDLLADELILDSPATVGDFWTFPDPGQYAIEVDAPAPWLPASLHIEVPQ